MSYFTIENILRHANLLSQKNSATGIDGISSHKYYSDQQYLKNEIQIIKRKVDNQTYDFSLYKEHLILKGADSLPRQISIATQRDQLVLKILTQQLTDAFDIKSKRSPIKKKIKLIKQTIMSKKYTHYIKVDIKSFFSSIDHNILLKKLKEKIQDNSTLSLIEKAIKQTTVSSSLPSKERTKYSNSEGLPQGLSISGILAEIYFSDIDGNYQRQGASLHYQRYVDDILMLCNEHDKKELCESITKETEVINLDCHEFQKNSGKSSTGFIDDGFQFLGYYFKGEVVSVREASINKIYQGITQVFLRYYKFTNDKDIKQLYYKLNLKITGCVIGEKRYGWLHFFSLINDKKLLFRLDAHIRNSFKRFNVPYQKECIKTFSRAHSELLNINSTRYIPKIKNLSQSSSVISTIKKEDLNEINEDVLFY